MGGGLLFFVLATANAAGYRYGVSDQAFYIPAVLRALDPSAFPHDGVLIDSQARLLVLDDVLGAIVRATGIPLDLLFFASYVLSVAIIWAGLLLIGRRVYGNWIATTALAAAFTLRHRISRTSANSFEPYFHPRMLAFGVGLLAVAAVLHRRRWLAIALVAAAAIVHVTTAIWFAVLVGIAVAVVDRAMRRLVIAGVGVVALVGAWAVTAGPLAASMVGMDDVWLQAVASKDSLFPTEWPAWVWPANLGLLAVLVVAHRVRQRRGEATAEDAALVWGAVALVALFLMTLPLVMLRLALPVQLQISRVFWLVDFLATMYTIAAIRPSWSRMAAALLIAVSLARGIYVITIEHPERGLVAVHLEQSPWTDAMRWVAQQPLDVHVLADPGHAWKYGTSVRVAAGRDVFLEEVKDSAIAMYSRDVATRVVERTAALGDFTTAAADRIAALSARYDLDYLVDTRGLPLPVVYRNSQFTVYALRRMLK